MPQPQTLLDEVLKLHKDIRTPFKEVSQAATASWTALTKELEASLKEQKGGSRGGRWLSSKIRQGSLLVSNVKTVATMAGFAKDLTSNIRVLQKLVGKLDKLEEYAAKNPNKIASDQAEQVCFFRRVYGQLLEAHVDFAQILKDSLELGKKKKGGGPAAAQMSFLNPDVESECSDQCSECEECNKDNEHGSPGAEPAAKKTRTSN